MAGQPEIYKHAPTTRACGGHKSYDTDISVAEDKSTPRLEEQARARPSQKICGTGVTMAELSMSVGMVVRSVAGPLTTVDLSGTMVDLAGVCWIWSEQGEDWTSSQ